MSPSPQNAEAAAPPHDNNHGDSNHEPRDARSVPSSPPPPPNPAADPRLVLQPPPPNLQPVDSPQLHAQPEDIFKVPALAALKLLSAGVEALVRVTGDIPPTPPPETPHVPHMRGMQAEKENIVRSYSEKSLARLRETAARQTQDAGSTPGPPHTIPGSGTDDHHMHAAVSSQQQQQQHTAADATPPAPYVIVGANSQPLNLQHSAITRKFYSKKPPPIGISDYLLRIHRFCPMSTAVYLAASLYIHRLAVDERAVAVTKRNAHRLLLAGLRVAMKVLEDLSYPHSKVAKVGGVSELELARLEISFCFLCGFELVVGAPMLQEHWSMMKNGPDLSGIGGGGGGGDDGGGGGGLMLNLKIPTHAGRKGRFSH
ncbi:cyclin-domain-containing protein [Coniella lustricola]|uniref:Cyclin-domain-containing protein n=1 Tax=Coniella lustricola TaxID=2025994 RepID=A0A2T3A676_9PEZI|nr:cyclin-domain-containing protein [Coniella lustricola]